MGTTAESGSVVQGQGKEAAADSQTVPENERGSFKGAETTASQAPTENGRGSHSGAAATAYQAADKVSGIVRGAGRAMDTVIDKGMELGGAAASLVGAIGAEAIGQQTAPHGKAGSGRKRLSEEEEYDGTGRLPDSGRSVGSQSGLTGANAQPKTSAGNHAANRSSANRSFADSTGEAGKNTGHKGNRAGMGLDTDTEDDGKLPENQRGDYDEDADGNGMSADSVSENGDQN